MTTCANKNGNISSVFIFALTPFAQQNKMDFKLQMRKESDAFRYILEKLM